MENLGSSPQTSRTNDVYNKDQTKCKRKNQNDTCVLIFVMRNLEDSYKYSPLIEKQFVLKLFLVNKVLLKLKNSFITGNFLFNLRLLVVE